MTILLLQNVKIKLMHFCGYALTLCILTQVIAEAAKAMEEKVTQITSFDELEKTTTFMGTYGDNAEKLSGDTKVPFSKI